MKYIISLVLASFCIIACNNSQSSKATNTASPADSTVAKDTMGFFPISLFIAGEVKMIDSLQLPITKTVTINKKAVLSPLTDSELKLLSKNFTEPDVNSPAVRDLYTKSNIADQSIPSISLILTANDKSLPVQKVNVFVKPDPYSNDKVNSIYIEKSFMLGDTAVSQKLYWKTGKSMQIITEKTIRQKPLPVEQLKVIWGPED